MEHLRLVRDAALREKEATDAQCGNRPDERARFEGPIGTSSKGKALEEEMARLND